MASFSPVVAGLRLSVAASGDTRLLIDGLSLAATQGCVNYEGEVETCPAVDTATHTFTVPLSGFFGVADYYVVNVQISGPFLDGAECIVQTTPTAPGPCKPSGESSYDGEVSGGEWVIRVPGDPGYLAVDPDFHADGFGGPFGLAHVWWPDDYYLAKLVNPSPPLPVPTGFYDNYYTMLMHTAAQLPAEISVTIVHTNYLQRVDGSILVGVAAYNETSEPPGEGGNVMYVGAA